MLSVQLLQMVKRPRNQQNGKERHHTIWQLGLGPVDTDRYTVAVRDKKHHLLYAIQPVLDLPDTTP